MKTPKYTCLIIEDEPLAAGLLEDYVKQVGFIEIAGVCGDALQAMDMIRKRSINLIFLDIHLPRLKGLDFLATLSFQPEVIITTAYHDYALRGYELNVTDYLLKPIEFARFLKAVNKLRYASVHPPVSAEQNTSTASLHTRPYFFVNVEKRKIKVFTDEILYLEGDREYVKIVAKDRIIRTRMPISKLDEFTLSDNFLRIHRSFIVALNAITSFSVSEVEVGGKMVPVGRSYRELVALKLSNL